MKTIRTVFNFLRETFTEFNEDAAPRLAAALSYYTVFSLAPLMIILITLVGLAFGQQGAQDQITAQLTRVIGAEGAQGVQMLIENVHRAEGTGIAALVSTITLLFGAMGVFGQLKGSLNTIWDVQPDPKRGVLGFLRDNLLSFAMLLVIGFLLMVSLVLQAVLAAITDYLARQMPFLAGFLPLLNLVLAFAVITVLLTLIFRVLPDREIAWRDVGVGAAVTAGLFVIGQFFVSLYLGRSGVSSTYGAAGSLVIIMLWVYYSSLILFFGAEFTQVFTRHYGSGKPAPAKHAVELDPNTKQPASAAQPQPQRQPAITSRPIAAAVLRDRPVPRRPRAAALFGAVTALAGLAAGLIVTAFRGSR